MRSDSARLQPFLTTMSSMGIFCLLLPRCTSSPSLPLPLMVKYTGSSLHGPAMAFSCKYDIGSSLVAAQTTMLTGRAIRVTWKALLGKRYLESVTWKESLGKDYLDSSLWKRFSNASTGLSRASTGLQHDVQQAWYIHSIQPMMPPMTPPMMQPMMPP